MNSKIIVMGFIGILIGGVGGYGLSTSVTSPQIQSLHAQITALQMNTQNLNQNYERLDEQYNSLLVDQNSLTTSYNQLSEQYDSLSKERDSIKTSYNFLKHEYDTLTDDHNTLTVDYNHLEYDYEYASSYWGELSNNVLELYDELNSYVNLNDAIPRVINYEEILEISDTIDSVTGRDTDSWDGYYKIHKYVRDDIKYAYDAEIPVITSYTYIGESYSPVVSGFDCEIRRNMIQTLEYTVEFEQGDCDDQAILEYCMIQYYREYILDVHYGLYLAHIKFNDDNSHVAVFMPVTEGRICILDPAGQYQTGSWNYIRGEDADRELLDYRDHWDEYDGIKIIKLYSIDIDTGYFDVAFEGSLFETIEYFTEH